MSDFLKFFFFFSLFWTLPCYFCLTPQTSPILQLVPRCQGEQISSQPLLLPVMLLFVIGSRLSLAFFCCTTTLLAQSVSTVTLSSSSAVLLLFLRSSFCFCFPFFGFFECFCFFFDKVQIWFFVHGCMEFHPTIFDHFSNLLGSSWVLPSSLERFLLLSVDVSADPLLSREVLGPWRLPGVFFQPGSQLCSRLAGPRSRGEMLF